MQVGIEKMNMYAGSLVLDIDKFAQARNKDAQYIKENLMIHRKAQNVDYEDVITMAVNAAKPIITEKDKKDIELCIFATESGLDYCKSNSSYICKYLDLNPNVRNFEIKNACYATTCAIQMAISWIVSQVSPGKKALIISSDINYNPTGRRGEEAPAVGSVVMLISDTPKIVEFELGKNGFYTFEVTDYARPTASYDIINGEESVYAYLECVEGAWQHYKQKAGDVDITSYFKKMIYHTPAGGVVRIAHSCLLKDKNPNIRKKEARKDFKDRVANSFLITNEVGHTYSGSVYMCLISLLLVDDELKAGDRIGVFSYGSGCCSEFFSMLVLPEAREYIKNIKLYEYFDSRYKLSVEEFDNLTAKRTEEIEKPTYETDLNYPVGWYDKYYKGKKLLIFKGVNNYVRKYEWS